MPNKRVNTWYFNLEDPMPELQRRLAAILLHYKIGREEIEGRFFMNSGRQDKLIIATQAKHQTIITPASASLIDGILRHDISATGVDPFVKSHELPENDNESIVLPRNGG